MAARQDLKVLIPDGEVIVSCDEASYFERGQLYTRSTMTIDRQYKAWNQPLLTTAVELLLEVTEARTVDLHDRLLVFPARQARQQARRATLIVLPCQRE